MAMANETHTQADAALSDAQVQALQAFRPDGSIIRSCPVDAARPSDPVLVAGLQIPGAGFSARNLEPVALSRNGRGFKPRSINQDIARDRWARDRITWNFTSGATTGDAGMKCHPDMASDPDLTDGHGKLIGAAPFFKLAKRDAGSLVCFGTSATYNSWDCVVFSSAEKRYRLWYRQQMAD